MEDNKEIILDLYYGKIKPFDMAMVRKEEYELISEKHLKAIEEFTAKLSPQLRKEFEQVCNISDEVDNELHIDGFCKGFQIGMRLGTAAIDLQK